MMPNVSFETIKSKDALSAYSATCIMIIVMYALSQGINGVTLATGTAVIGGLGGYQISKRKTEE